MRIHFAVDNALELVGAGLLIAGVAVTVGLGISLVVAAACVLALAEFSWAGKVWTVRTPALRFSKARRAERRSQRELLNVQGDLATAKQAADHFNSTVTAVSAFGEHLDGESAPRFDVYDPDNHEVFVPELSPLSDISGEQ